MSRWLSGLNQVSNLLEQLDDRVENVAEERAFGEGEDDEESGALGDILAKRGLLEEAHDSDDGGIEEDEEELNEETNSPAVDLEAGMEASETAANIESSTTEAMPEEPAEA